MRVYETFTRVQSFICMPAVGVDDCVALATQVRTVVGLCVYLSLLLFSMCVTFGDMYA